ncbi:hypothetical protein [Govanella unica]|uniref:Uncharacterized protein n=1 Tax=Govanella unica TaxID=2975056 RepID=A0A9X3TVT9_9PROT|nr:hypothetical protein [Govania unica]MDA5192688.1 hypothetical protein [Govania unica]
MKVISPLADLDVEVGSITREGNMLVVKSAEGKGIPTTVYIKPQDALTLLRAIFGSRSAVGFLLLFPLYWWRARKGGEEAVADHDNSDLNNPWA